MTRRQKSRSTLMYFDKRYPLGLLFNTSTCPHCIFSTLETTILTHRRRVFWILNFIYHPRLLQAPRLHVILDFNKSSGICVKLKPRMCFMNSATAYVYDRMFTRTRTAFNRASAGIHAHKDLPAVWKQR